MVKGAISAHVRLGKQHHKRQEVRHKKREVRHKKQEVHHKMQGVLRAQTTHNQIVPTSLYYTRRPFQHGDRRGALYQAHRPGAGEVAAEVAARVG